MLDRKIPPNINPVTTVPKPGYEKVTLDNGIPLYIIEAGTQPVLKMEIVFNAGRPFESNPLVARTTARLLKEGTKGYTASDIAERTDFFGSNISAPVHLDTSSLVFHCLARHLSQLLPMWTEILTQPIFPETELRSFVQNNLQRLTVDLSKNDVQAYRRITESLFGSKHPYGYNSVPETYTGLQTDWLKAHFQKCYVAENCMIFLSGKPEKNALSLINESLGRLIPKGEKAKAFFPPIKESITHRHHSNPQSAQTAIRIGNRLFTRKHPDYPKFFVLNTILGGYFGSRLMTNLREDKGYTYNIYSSLDAMHEEGAFLIGAEVSNEHRDQAVQEIKDEIELLRSKPIAPEELKMVRSYLMGSFLSMMDGPFNISEIVRTTMVEKLREDHFSNLVKTVSNIQAEDLQELAQKYLDTSKMSIMTVGPQAQ